jgi:hypothetical protein
VYCDDAAGSVEYIITQHEDANNYWWMARTSGGGLGFYKRTGGSVDLDASGGSAVSQNNWHHVAMCKVAGEVGTYIDGTQVGYDGSWAADTFAGPLEIGRYGGGSNYFDGKMQDFAIVYSNIFGAAPNSTPDDTITIDTLNPLRLVI